MNKPKGRMIRNPTRIHRTATVDGDLREFTYDFACERCGDDDPLTERQRPVATRIQWVCQDCARETLSPSRTEKT